MTAAVGEVTGEPLQEIKGPAPSSPASRTTALTRIASSSADGGGAETTRIGADLLEPLAA